MKNLIERIKRQSEVRTFENLPSTNYINEPLINTPDNSFGLPNDYLEFLSYANGATLFMIEDIAGFKFLSLEELVTANDFQKENYGTDWDNDVILFCQILGDNEYLGFKKIKEGYTIVHCIMEEFPNEWQQINGNFKTLLESILKFKGEKYWLHD